MKPQIVAWYESGHCGDIDHYSIGVEKSTGTWLVVHEGKVTEVTGVDEENLSDPRPEGYYQKIYDRAVEQAREEFDEALRELARDAQDLKKLQQHLEKLNG